MTDRRKRFVPDTSPEPGTALYLSFEKKESKQNKKMYWVLGISDAKTYTKTNIPYKDWDRLGDVIDKYRTRLGLSEDFEVYSVHEAGREGHSLYRKLVERGIKSIPIDPASPDGKKNKPGKTDRLDAEKLVRLLVHYIGGDHEVFSEINPPTLQIEDERELGREYKTLKDQQTAHLNRIRSLLFKHGIDRGADPSLMEELDQLRTSTGKKLGEHLKARIRREYRRLQLVQDQIKEVSNQIRTTVKEQKDSNSRIKQAVRLYQWKGFGIESCYRLIVEGFGWRNFRNRGETSGFIGFDDVPYESGTKSKRQGISKQGNSHLRGLAVQLAWNWIRHQPDSELTKWYKDKAEEAPEKEKTKYIVALARKLMNRVRVFLQTGEVPNGALMKADPRITL